MLKTCFVCSDAMELPISYFVQVDHLILGELGGVLGVFMICNHTFKCATIFCSKEGFY